MSVSRLEQPSKSLAFFFYIRFRVSDRLFPVNSPSYLIKGWNSIIICSHQCNIQPIMIYYMNQGSDLPGWFLLQNKQAPLNR